MFSWLFIQAVPSFNNDGTWYARWRWDDRWATGRYRADAIRNLQRNSV